jgi:hypothetical protein
MALAVLLSQHGESMDEILNTPATPAQCAAHDANIEVRHIAVEPWDGVY